ncbi:hypothetical protein QVD17_02267 [Tagetes erecta]|uniref:C2H2-type domain-containing protein n=1 Tax=Tagetes erecta TaxID=13708 RepID=A0AAD8P8V8_TARER|nr:hypothetical protein QVD17_02267 [Tagetes erecta]
MSISDRNLVAKSDQELKKHMCKLCNKGFPCGRSLGGHMRSHVINSTDHHHQKMNNYTDVINGCSNSNDLGYELRKDPKKTLKAVTNDSSSNDFVVLDKLCKECGKGFQSWKALFGHMKCHSDKVSKVSSQDYWIKQRDNATSGMKTKKSRSRNGASSSDSMNANHASTSVVSDIDDDDDVEEAEIAMCLIMLSRDVGKWGKKMIENGCKMKKIVGSELGVHGFKETAVTRDEFDDQFKRNFECSTCNKSFDSYQALGGHKASHKKLKGCLDSKTDDNDIIKSEPVLDHDHMINGSCGKTSDNHQSSSSFNLGESLKNTMVVRASHKKLKRCFELKTDDNEKIKSKPVLDRDHVINGCCVKTSDIHQSSSSFNLGDSLKNTMVVGASHKKLKRCFESKTNDNEKIQSKPVLDRDHMINGCCVKTSDIHQSSSSFNLGDSLKSTMVVGAHECSICLRIFSSGQALGGHKRSHLVAEAKLNRQNASSVTKINKPVHEIRGSFDLNMPPDDLVEEEQEIGYNPWCYNPEPTLLGLLSTS